MTEEPTPPSEDPNEVKKARRFNKPDVRREPSPDFWDLESGGEDIAEVPEKPRDLPAPFAKGDSPEGGGAEESDMSAAKVEPRAPKGAEFVQTYKQEAKAPELEEDEIPRMPGDFESLDGTVEPREREQKPEAPAPVQEPAPAGEEEEKPSPVMRGIRASEHAKSEDVDEDEEKRKPVDARLKAERVEQKEEADEFSKAGKPGDAGPRMVGFRDIMEWARKLSLFEKASMVIMLVMVAVFAAVMFLPALVELSGHGQRAEAADFPKQGQHVQVKSAETYWREPVTTGEHADVVRRDTALIPVVEMQVSGGPALLRVLFKNDDGDFVGDPVARETSGEATLAIAGTAGFDQVGMHAAYRTGQTDPWTVLVYEAPPGGDADDFKLIFEMDLSALLK